jgi:hypothetical protein
MNQKISGARAIINPMTPRRSILDFVFFVFVCADGFCGQRVCQTLLAHLQLILPRSGSGIALASVCGMQD